MSFNSSRNSSAFSIHSWIVSDRSSAASAPFIFLPFEQILTAPSAPTTKTTTAIVFSCSSTSSIASSMMFFIFNYRNLSTATAFMKRPGLLKGDISNPGEVFTGRLRNSKLILLNIFRFNATCIKLCVPGVVLVEQIPRAVFHA